VDAYYQPGHTSTPKKITFEIIMHGKKKLFILMEIAPFNYSVSLQAIVVAIQGRRSRSGWSGHGLTTFGRSFGKGRWCYMCALHASAKQ
jgi:hypothetical protein